VANFPNAQFAHFPLELADVVRGPLLGGVVAAVHEAVDKDFFDFRLLGHSRSTKRWLMLRVHAAVAERPIKCNWRWRPALHGLLEERDLVESFGFGDDEMMRVDVHVDDAAGADVEVADFAVAHLAFGRPTEGAGGLDQGCWGICAESRRKWVCARGRRR